MFLAIILSASVAVTMIYGRTTVHGWLRWNRFICALGRLRISIIPNCILDERRLVGKVTCIEENAVYSILKNIRICMLTKKVRVPLTGIWG